jgi:hypothetical protein
VTIPERQLLPDVLSESHRVYASGYRRARLTVSIWLLIISFMLVLIPQVIFFGPLLGYMSGLGDPVARGVFEVGPSLELIAPFLSARLLPKHPKGICR